VTVDSLAVVAVTYSPGETLPPFLASVRTAAHWPLTGPRIVLADNGSADGSVEAAAGTAGVTVLHTGGNLGFGGGANAGVAALPAEVSWVVVCNPDLVFAPGALDELLAATSRWPSAGAFGPQILTVDGKVYPSARELPSVVRGIGHAVLGWWWPTNPWTKAYRRDHEAPAERTAGWLSGACLLLRREAFEAVGGFDERYFMYFEDVDLGDRLGRAGWQNVYVPSAVVTHIGGHSTSGHAAAMTSAHHDSAYRYLAGRYPARWQAPLRWALRAGLAARRLLARRSSAVSEGAAVPETPAR
jgi:N-acetylglucosaminyl-diphospho-decaprenol L-rhamnosyltransferase